MQARVRLQGGTVLASTGGVLALEEGLQGKLLLLLLHIGETEEQIRGHGQVQLLVLVLLLRGLSGKGQLLLGVPPLQRLVRLAEAGREELPETPGVAVYQRPCAAPLWDPSAACLGLGQTHPAAGGLGHLEDLARGGCAHDRRRSAPPQLRHAEEGNPRLEEHTKPAREAWPQQGPEAAGPAVDERPGLVAVDGALPGCLPVSQLCPALRDLRHLENLPSAGGGHSAGLHLRHAPQDDPRLEDHLEP
mmetsp:Transcript_50365/g.150556  ORF Transcript_50365/g.150556 Transcript_50365/m.150556 type:complete len:247 (+) Transcript_50365:245-985(+)